MIKIILNKYKFINTGLIILVFIILEYSYKTFVSEIFQYRGFFYEFNIYKHLISKTIFLVIIFYHNYSKISDFIYSITSLFIVFLLIPNLILFQAMDFYPLIIISITFFILLLIFAGQYKIRTIIKIPQIKDNQKVILLISLALIMLLPFLAVYKFNLNLDVLLFKDIYETRAENGLKGNILTAYFYGWLAKVVLPILLVYGLHKKNTPIILFSIASLLYLFLIISQKSVLFTSIIVVFFYFIKTHKKQISLILSGIIFIFLFSRIYMIATGNIYLESLFIRRVFFIPALLNQFYFDFFANNHLYLSHSIFKSFIDYPYDLNPSHLIGKEYFSSEVMSANNGFISDGFMNFGIFGIFLNIIFVISLIKFFDSQKISSKFFGIFILMIFSLLSSFFLTNLLTHGIILLILLTIFIFKNTNKAKS